MSADSEGKDSGSSRSADDRLSEIASRYFANTSALQATGRLLRRQLWLWPLFAAIVFGGAGWWVHRSVEDAMREQRATDLNAIVDASVTALNVWMAEQRINAQLFAQDNDLRPHIAELLSLDDGSPAVERKLAQSSAQEKLRLHLTPRMALSGYAGYVVVAPNGLVLAADQSAPVGSKLTGYRKAFFDQIAAGQNAMSQPSRSTLLLADEKGELRVNLPTMYVAAPVRDAAGKPLASLGLRIRPEDQFTRILEVTRFGESGETYAFDRNGLMLSQSRFDDHLKQIGLLADQPEARSILTIELRDPQVNMVAGERPPLRRADQPLTRLAAAAVKGQNGHDADGYRGYDGLPKVGAWRWLDEHELGIATEVDAAEAFRPVRILRRAFWVLMLLLGLSAVGIFLGMLFIARQQRDLQKATLAVKQLGRYTLEEKLGAGGMGTVYKARHAMLHRPTAVKLLDLEKMSKTAVLRFEREVQLTSALTHPNTVAVFDYGPTADGIFYYAMEYLEGLNLEQLVRQFGPVSEARMVYILKQVCGSLAEAHAAGMIHRDVKPANIFLTCRGGMHDFVKVLDFGLVTLQDAIDQTSLTGPEATTGTPYYISPEAVNHRDQVDARSDVYALGAVGYYLLTGTPVFNGANMMEICMKHVHEEPESPSSRRGAPVSRDLEALLLGCLAKSPSGRPANAAKLLQRLETCTIEGTWTAGNAADWWAGHQLIAVPNASTTVRAVKDGTMR